MLLPLSATHEARASRNACGILVECKYYGLNGIPLPPKSPISESPSPAPQKVALIRNRVATDAITWDEVIARQGVTGVLVRRGNLGGEADVHAGRPCNLVGRDSGDVHTSQGVPGVAGNCQKLGESEQILPHSPPWEATLTTPGLQKTQCKKEQKGEAGSLARKPSWRARRGEGSHWPEPGGGRWRQKDRTRRS